MEHTGYKGHGFQVSIEHFLSLFSALTIALTDEFTSFSSPVKYPNFSLSTRMTSRSPFKAAVSNRYHPSMNSLLYSRDAPKSISWSRWLTASYRKFAQLGSVCMKRNWKSSWRQRRRMLVPI